MKIYLVGGAIRDQLLGLEVEERDWVVVGSSAKEMLAMGYQPVGKDFPVFLHPETHEEYALARTERKKGHGYYGFEVNAEANVSLEEDLQRRDLTINAMAKSTEGEIIDPYGGQQDLKHKVLRHVSTAFSEDPLRVLRVARFAAKYASLGFTIADETLQMMHEIVVSKEILELAAERIWQESSKALTTTSPAVYYKVLYDCGALAQTFPKISDVFDEKTAREHGLSALYEIAKQQQTACTNFAALIGGLYFSNSENNETIVSSLCKELRLSKECKNLLLLTIALQHECHDVFSLDENEQLKLLQKIDARRQPERFAKLLKIFSAIYMAIHNVEEYKQAQWLQIVAQKINAVNTNEWVQSGISGKELAEKLHQEQLKLITKLMEKYLPVSN